MGKKSFTISDIIKREEKFNKELLKVTPKDYTEIMFLMACIGQSNLFLTELKFMEFELKYKKTLTP